ncbi:haloacid dehalogenase [Amanita muscaria]
MAKLTDYEVLVFDVYGTLVDWETGLYDALQPLLTKYPVSASWDRKEALMAYMSVERDLQAQYPDMLYFDLLLNAHKTLDQRLKSLSEQDADEKPNTITTSEAISTEDDTHTTFAKTIREWRAFPDSTEALRELANHFRLCVLSNVDYDSFRYAHARLSEGHDVSLTPKKLSLYSYPRENNPNRHWFPRSAPDDNKSPFTLVLTSEEVKAYKPSLVGFRAFLQCVCSDPRLLGEEGKSAEEVKEKVLVVAQSLPHDHVPARELDIKSVWIDRQSAVTCNELPDGAGQKWTWRFETLGEMVDAVKAELAQR